MVHDQHRNSLKKDHQLHWYRIDKVLGQGGFGITYLAHDPNLDQYVAIKEYLPMEFAVRDGDNSVHPASSANGERYRWGLDRFITEARTLAKFKHPAIVRVLSVFEENNTAYMVMEYEHGESLQQVLDRRKTLGEDELIPILAPLLDGLELIHSTGFIHRDIKPANIYIRADGTPVLLDFGSARQALGGQTKSLTSIVSPGYAPFEQYYSKTDRQGPWTDIYALAATMYRAISGILPMNAIDRSEAILKAERDLFVSVSEIGQDRYSVRFMRALDHALSFSEKQRPQSIAQWRGELGFDDRISAPTSPIPSAAQPSATRFETPPVPPDELATALAGRQALSGRELDVPRAATVPAPSSQTIPAAYELRPPIVGRRWWIVGAAVVALGLTMMVYNHTGSAPRSLISDVKNALVSLLSGVNGAQERADRLVAQGDRALAAGLIFEPLTDSAVDYYRRVIDIAPQHAGALQGIALVSPRIVSAIEDAIALGDLERAGEFLRTLRALPDQQHLIVMLEEELGEAQAMAAANVVQRRRIKEFLNEAATDFAEGRLLMPSGNNALVRYRAIQMLDPDNIDARRGIAAIVSKLTEEHETALAVRDFTLAGKRLKQVEPFLKKDRVEQLQQAFDVARKRDAAESEHAARVAELLQRAAADLKANRLSTPAGGSAVDRYRAVLKLDPQNAEAAAGLVKVGARYIDLADAAIRNRQLDNARDYIERARTLGRSSSTLQRLSTQLKTVENQIAEENVARAVAQERQRLAVAAAERQDRERLRLELEVARETAAAEKRRRQEVEAKRLFELEQNKQRAREAQQVVADRSTLVVEVDGFSSNLELYGLKENEIRADIESRLSALGYNVVLHHQANRSMNTRLFLIRFRANLNSASGMFSYAASLALYDQVPKMANSIARSGLRPVWEKGTSGVAIQTDLQRVRGEYNLTMRNFTTEVGKAPGRL